jgi:hypothetical protein
VSGADLYRAADRRTARKILGLEFDFVPDKPHRRFAVGYPVCVPGLRGPGQRRFFRLMENLVIECHPDRVRTRGKEYREPVGVSAPVAPVVMEPAPSVHLHQIDMRIVNRALPACTLLDSSARGPVYR